MKKVLYGTTALVAAGVMGAGSADAKISLGLGGYMNTFFSVASINESDDVSQLLANGIPSLGAAESDRWADWLLVGLVAALAISAVLFVLAVRDRRSPPPPDGQGGSGGGRNRRGRCCGGAGERRECGI